MFELFKISEMKAFEKIVHLVIPFSAFDSIKYNPRRDTLINPGQNVNPWVDLNISSTHRSNPNFIF